MKIGAIFVLYNPCGDTVKSLSKLCDGGVSLCFVDNSPSPVLDAPFPTIKNYNSGGISGAFNVGIKELRALGCDFIFTFDQDSVLPDTYFDAMRNFIVEKEADIVCPNFFDLNSKTFGKFVTLGRYLYSTESRDTTTFTISSGMGFSSSSLELLLPFNEDFIIDHVDTDICLRALDLSIPIYVNRELCLDHRIGERQKKSILGITIKPNNHNSTRRYYIARNGTYLARKYIFKYPSYFALNVLRLAHEVVGVLFFECNKKQKINAIFRGVLDSSYNRLGPARF